MTDAALLPASRFAESDFRVGTALWRTLSIFWRNFPAFFAVTAIAGLPPLLLANHSIAAAGFSPLLQLVLSTLSQAIVLYAAFQDMRGRPVNLRESAQVGLRRFFPIVGVTISMTLLSLLGLILLVVPGLIWLTKWLVAMPACVVESLGVSDSLKRSSELTMGHRWKLFGMLAVWFVLDAIVDDRIDTATAALATGLPAAAVHAIWSGIWGAFYAIFGVVAYHDLRVAKEGVDTEQIAAVFE
jgi:hypothetical protein